MKNQKVFFVHGLDGTPNGSWRPWVMRELEKVGIYAAALAFPSPHKPVLSEWMSVLDYNVKLFPSSKIVLVGHSLGVPAILQYLQKYKPKNVTRVILIAGPIQSNKKIIENFFDLPFDYASIKRTAKRFLVVHGDNDKIVPYSHAIDLSKYLNCTLCTIKNGGHLNEYDGCLELPEIVAEITV